MSGAGGREVVVVVVGNMAKYALARMFDQTIWGGGLFFWSPSKIRGIARENFARYMLTVPRLNHRERERKVFTASSVLYTQPKRERGSRLITIIRSKFVSRLLKNVFCFLLP